MHANALVMHENLILCTKTQSKCTRFQIHAHGNRQEIKKGIQTNNSEITN
jgi:hypothetical protein